MGGKAGEVRYGPLNANVLELAIQSDTVFFLFLGLLLLGATFLHISEVGGAQPGNRFVSFVRAYAWTGSSKVGIGKN